MSGAAEGGVRTLLRVEGACVRFAAAWLHARSGPGRGSFAPCLLAPDRAFPGDLRGPRIDALAGRIDRAAGCVR